MALFGLIKNKYEKEHPIEWFFSDEGKKAYYQMKGDMANSMRYYQQYLKNFPNYDKCAITYGEASIILTAFDTLTVKDKLGIQRPAKWTGWPNILDRKKNKLMDFLYRIDHNITGREVWNLIVTLCFYDDLDFDGKDSWLINASFWKRPNVDLYDEIIKYTDENDIELPPRLFDIFAS